MKIIEFNKIKEREIINHIRMGSIFIYPTDTIYGLGCNALNGDSVKKIREIKQRYTRPFSIIAPSKQWIKENCEITDEAEKWLNKLPGPYTLILNLKNKTSISPNTNSDMGTIGIRIPDHWCSDCAKELNIPIVTTSANIIDKDFMTSIEDLDDSIKAKVDFIIYEGEKKARPSKLIDLTKEKTEVIER